MSKSRIKWYDIILMNQSYFKIDSSWHWALHCPNGLNELLFGFREAIHDSLYKYLSYFFHFSLGDPLSVFNFLSELLDHILVFLHVVDLLLVLVLDSAWASIIFMNFNLQFLYDFILIGNLVLFFLHFYGTVLYLIVQGCHLIFVIFYLFILLVDVLQLLFLQLLLFWFENLNILLWLLTMLLFLTC